MTFNFRKLIPSLTRSFPAHRGRLNGEAAQGSAGAVAAGPGGPPASGASHNHLFSCSPAGPGGGGGLRRCFLRSSSWRGADTPTFCGLFQGGQPLPCGGGMGGQGEESGKEKRRSRPWTRTGLLPHGFRELR